MKKVILKLLLLVAVTISGQHAKAQFRVETVCDTAIHLNIPTGFIHIDSSEKFTLFKNVGFLPDEVFMNRKDSSMLVCTWGKIAMAEDPVAVDQMLQRYVNRFDKLYPGADWHDFQTIIVNGKAIGYMETSDKVSYNFIFITSVKGKQLHVVFRSDVKLRDKYKDLVRKIWEKV